MGISGDPVEMGVAANLGRPGGNVTGIAICRREPERIARLLVDKGYTPDYEYAVEVLKDMPYDKWREYDP